MSYRGRLAFHARANRVQLASRTEFLVLAGDEIRIGLHENLSGRPEVEFSRLVAEKFAMNAGPNKPAVGVDVHFGHAKLCCREVFVLIHAARARVEFATG